MARIVAFRLRPVEPGQPVVTEHYTSAAEVHKRWQDLQERFKGEGWWGPTAGL